MNQKTSIDPSTRSSPHPSINPALQAALGSLDVQLEEELARYRRQRAGRPVMSPRGLGRHQVRKPIDLISVDKAAGQTPPPSAGQLPPASMPSFPLPLVNPTPAAAPPKETLSEPMERMAHLDASSAVASEPADIPLASASPLNKLALSNSTPEENVTEQLTPRKEPEEVDGDLVHSPVPQSPPEDYLESSEQLLRSLAEDEVESQPQSQKSFTDRLLTPLGVGLMLLLLLSSATVAYIATNPSTLKAMGLGGFFGSKTPTTAQRPTETTQAKATPKPVQESPTLEGPNLAAEEFPEVNLDNLSQLEASPSPIPSSPPPSPLPPLADLPNSQTAQPAPPVAPNPSLPGRSSDLSAALLPPSIQPGAVAPATAPPVVPIPAPAAPRPVTPAPRASTPSSAPANFRPSPAPATPATARKPETSPAPSPAPVAANDAPVQDDYYRVLLNYDGDRTLEQARTIVPDAYVINLPEGTRIQVGAFKRESEAKTLADQLRQQGISASINRP